MKKEHWIPYTLLLPCILMVAILYGYPILVTIYQSFHKVHLLNAQMDFIGWDNYIRAFTDFGFYTTLKITFQYTVLTVFLKVGIGFLLAFLLYGNLFFKKILRFLSLVPWAIPEVAVSTLWIWILDGKYGYLNYYLMKLHIIKEPILFLSKPATAFFSAAFVDAWLGVSLISMMFLSGLEQIPTSLYEASQIDGAGKFRQFFDITLPGIKKTFITILILVTIWTFNSFNVIFVLTQGGPMRATETLILRIYQEAFSRFDIGMSSTLSVITVMMLLVMTIVYMRSLKYEE